MGECLMFGMDVEARCLTSVTADEDTVSFLVGTNNIKSENVVNKLYVNGDGGRLLSKSFKHPTGEVRAMVSSPSDPAKLATCAADYSTTNGSFSFCIWNIEDDKRTLESVSQESSDQLLHGITWEPHTNRIATVASGSIQIFDVQETPKALQTIPIEGQANSASWSPHHNGNLLGIAVDDHVVGFDTRTTGDQLKIASAHAHRTLNLDFNPNLQNSIATCGNDGHVRIWDLRSPTEPKLDLNPHAHWVWQVKYHPVHDQLLLSVGSDSCVVLSCAQSVSSEQFEPSEEEEDEDEHVERLQDGQLERIEEHEDSVYSCAWSSADPWTFASLSYDGRVILSKISRKHKYALMQL